MFYIKVKNLGKNLRSKDLFNKNDLFIIIKFNGQERRTTTKWDKNQPVWNESFLFDVSEDLFKNSDHAKLDFIIYDEDTWSSDEVVKKDSLKINKSEKIEQNKMTNICGIDIEYGFVKCVNYSKFIELNNKNNKFEQLMLEMQKKLKSLQSRIQGLEYEKDTVYNKYIQIKNRVVQFLGDCKSI